MRTVSGLLVFVSIAAGGVVRGDEPNHRELLAAVEKQLRDTATTVGPSIATIVVSRSELYPKAEKSDTPGKLGGFDPREFLKNNPTPERAELARTLDLSDPRTLPDHGYAGGVVIDPAGYVLTPYHVIEGAAKVHVFFPGGAGSYADIHAADARADLAVLRLINPPPKLQAIKFADVRTFAVGNRKATVFTGKLCVLMANPYSTTFGLGKPSAGFGSITNVRFRPVNKESRAGRYSEYGTLLEYDIRGNSAMTGGVLLNLDGEMIGLTNSAAVVWGNEIGPGFAMPADDNFRRIVDVLRRGEEVEYGFLGVTLNRARNGVIVDQPTPLGPASLAGLEIGDEIRSVNGIPIENFDDLLLQVGSALAGAKVKVTVSRFGRIMDFTATLGKFAHDQPWIASVRPEPVLGLRVDYGSILSQKNIIAIPPGVCIRELTPESPAAKAFKTVGDFPERWIITHVDGVAVKSPSEFYNTARGREKIKLTLVDPKDSTRRELTLP
jgi:serine protease Do